jgi:hypothetical protein
MLCEDPPDHILIDLDSKSMGDLLRDPRTAERIAALHLDDHYDEFFRRSLRTRLTPMSG